MNYKNGLIRQDKLDNGKYTAIRSFIRYRNRVDVDLSIYNRNASTGIKNSLDNFIISDLSKLERDELKNSLKLYFSEYDVDCLTDIKGVNLI